MNKLVAFVLMVHMSSAMAVDRIVILGLFKDKAVLEIDGKRQILSVGEHAGNGVTLIAANSNEAVLEIDGIRNSYTLGTHIGSSFREPESGTTVSIAPDSHGMYRVNGSINGHLSSFIVDTGATLITMNKHEARRFGIDYMRTGIKAVSSTASGIENIYVVNLRTVSVGDIQLETVPAAIHDSDYPEVILLGNSFLNKVSIKRDHQLMQLVK